MVWVLDDLGLDSYELATYDEVDGLIVLLMVRLARLGVPIVIGLDPLRRLFEGFVSYNLAFVVDLLV